MIEVLGLTKTYGKTKALNNISFSVDKGQILGLLGPNGAGKTTAMRTICGVINPDSGSVKINGIDVTKNPIHTKGVIGYLPENPPLYSELKVKEQLYYVARLKGLSGSKIIKSMDEVVASCGLSSVTNKLIANLSKGFKQRTGLAQALINNPSVLVLDEPTVGLDPMQIIEIRKLIKSMADKRTVILSSHILSEVQSICTKVLILNKGDIVASGDSKNISDKFLDRHIYEITVSNFDDKLKTLISSLEDVATCYAGNEIGKIVVETKHDSDLRSKISKIVIQNGYELFEFKEIQSSLEDAFIRLTGDGEKQ